MILPIDSGDFVNQGRDKVNLAFGEIPVGFEIDEETGDLVITKHNNQIIRTPLANVFARLQHVAEAVLPAQATAEHPGLVQLVDDEIPEQLDSETGVLSAAAVVRYVESVTENLPAFGALVEGQIPIVRTKGGKPYIAFMKPEELCELLATAGCGGSTGGIDPNKTIESFDIDVPTAIDEGVLTTQAKALITYSDKTTASVVVKKADGWIWSVVGQGETISETGVLSVPGNRVTGDTHNLTIRLVYRLPGQLVDTAKTKQVTINDTSALQNVVTLADIWEPFYIDDTLPDFVGLVEGVDCSKLRFWGVDAAHPNTPPQFDILSDGVKVTTVTASMTRSDVSDVYNLDNTAGHLYGVWWTIPDSLKDGRRHVLTVFFAGTSTQLPNDGDVTMALTCTPPDNAACPNLALMSTGGTAAASSVYQQNGTLFYPPERAFNGDRIANGWTGAPGNTNTGWNSQLGDVWPQWIERDFGQARSIAEFEVVCLRDNLQSTTEPTDQETFTAYGLIDFDFQYWNGASWVTIPGGAIRGNNRVVRRVRLATPINAQRFRIFVIGAGEHYARVVEFIMRACLTGPADQPALIAFTNAPGSLDEGSGVDLVAKVTYPDGRQDTVTASTGSFALAAETGEFTTANNTTTAVVTGTRLGSNGRFTADANTTYGDGRKVRIRVTAYGLSDTRTVSIVDKTSAPVQPTLVKLARAYEPYASTGGNVFYYIDNGTTTAQSDFGGPNHPLVQWINVSTNTVNDRGLTFILDNSNQNSATMQQALTAGYRYYAYANIGKAGEIARVRIWAHGSATTYQEFNFVIPADHTTVALTQIYP